MKTKEEVIKEAYVELIGEERFDRLKDYIDFDGWIDFDYLPEDISIDSFNEKYYTE